MKTKPKPKTIKLEILAESRGRSPVVTVAIAEGLPFAKPQRGLLVHRVRAIQRHSYGDKWSHETTHYHCGAFCSRVDYYDDPPAGGLVCERCEFMAKKRGKPTADDLAGRHVHTGRLEVKQTCCCGGNCGQSKA